MVNYTTLCGPPLEELLYSEEGTTGLYYSDSVKAFLDYVNTFQHEVRLNYAVLTDQSLSDPSEMPFIFLRVLPQS